MSHFTVTVTTPNGTDEEIQAALAPFHEFECTGLDDEYVQDVDITDEVNSQWYDTDAEVVRGPDGTMYSPYKLPDSWYRPATSQEIAQIQNLGRRDVPFEYKSGDSGTYLIKDMPEGTVKVTVKYGERETLEGNSFIEWLGDYYGCETLFKVGDAIEITEESKYGYAIVDENNNVVKVFKRTNPNKKWDWYQIGGRWSGLLKTKAGTRSGRLGERSWTNQNEDLAGVDIAKKSDIDFDGMKQEIMSDRNKKLAEAISKIEQNTGWGFSETSLAWIRLNETTKEQKALWEAAGNGKPFWEWLNGVTGLRELEKILYPLTIIGVDDEVTDLRDWANNPPAFSTWAFLGTDGVWREKGEMGWFGFSHNHVEGYQDVFSSFLDSVPDDHYIAIVDCHI